MLEMISMKASVNEIGAVFDDSVQALLWYNHCSNHFSKKNFLKGIRKSNFGTHRKENIFIKTYSRVS